MGFTYEDFQILGRKEFWKNNSKIDARGDATEDAIFFNKIGGKWSGPPADLAFNLFRILKTFVRVKAM